MTQKERDLLLKDICARLPYGVKCAEVYPDGNKFENEWDIIRISKYVEDGVHISNCKTIYSYCSQIQNIKPYLFPLSSMTDEQKKEYALVMSSNNLSYSHLLGMSAEDWFNKNHFDYRGLIPMGLAIDATNKNIY